MQDWRDDRLRWKVEDFDNLSNVVLRPDRIWLPELALMNGFVTYFPTSRLPIHLIFLLLPQFTVLILIILMQLIHAYQLFILSFF